jgi:hypothetical protein
MAKKDLHYRAFTLPTTVDEENRSLEAIAATDQPVAVFDWERGEVVDEVLLIQGARIPANGQLPLLNAHSRFSTGDVIGSARNLRKEDNELLTTVVFSEVKEADDAFTKYREGHLTDFSVGYAVADSEWIPDGETRKISGQSFTGPMRVVTDWPIKELSAVPIGADDQAKARAETHKPQPEREKTMTDQDKKELEELRALKVQNEEAQAQRDADAQRLADAEKLKTKEEEEKSRNAELMAIGEKYNIPLPKVRKWVTDGTTISDALKDALDHVERRINADEGAPGLAFGIDETDKFREASELAILERCGKEVDAEKMQGNPMAGRKLLDFARESCHRENINTSRMKDTEIVKRALTTSDFPYLLAATQNKFLFDGFSTAQETWQIFCSQGALPDYKDNTFPRSGEYTDLGWINPDDGEYKYGSTSEAKETIALKKFGRLVRITDAVIVNDDLGAFTDTPTKLGRAAARAIGNAVYQGHTDPDTSAVHFGTLLSNSGTGETMGDSNNLFDATNHSNYLASGSGGAPTLAALNAGAKAMATQTDTAGNAYLNIQPNYIIAGYSLKATIDNLLTTVGPVAVSTSTATNPWSYLVPVYDARIDGAIATWWALAGPSDMTVKVFGLGGMPGPTIDSQMAWTSDSIEYKVRSDFASKAMDWRGLYANYGA